MEVDTKTAVQDHAKWIVEKVAEAREIGTRDGADGLKVGHVIALLFKQCDEKDKRIAELEAGKIMWKEEFDIVVRERNKAEAKLDEISDMHVKKCLAYRELQAQLILKNDLIRALKNTGGFSDAFVNRISDELKALQDKDHEQ